MLVGLADLDGNPSSGIVIAGESPGKSDVLISTSKGEAVLHVTVVDR